MLKKWKIRWVENQIWVAICCTALAFFIQINLNKININLLIIQFLATLSMYKLAVHSQQINFKIFSFHILLPGLLAAIIGFVYLKTETLLLLAFLAVLSLQYSFPLLGKNFRKIQRLKIFIIASIWASSIVFLPILDSGELIGIQTLLLWVSIFLFVLAISIPFDWRDSDSDAAELKTLPQELGKEQSLKLANRVLVLSILFFILAQETIVNSFIFSFLLTVVLASFLFKKPSKFSKKYFVSFWVEILSAMPLLIYGMLQLLNQKIF